MNLNAEVSNRIAVLRPILIYGVVFVHVQGMSELMSQVGPGIFYKFAAFFRNGVFRGTVPTLALISGYLLFSANLDQAPMKMLSKKFRTLVIPLLFFNLATIALWLVMKACFGLVFFTDVTQATPMQWMNMIVGATAYPVNGPLYFVRDMIVTIMLAPLLGWLLRRFAWIGLAAVAIVFGTDQDGDLIMRGTSLILFYIGGMAAVKRWNVLMLDKYAGYCLGAFVVLCLAKVVFVIDNKVILVMSAPFLLWPSMALVRHTKVEAWALKYTRYSFFVFAAHMPFMMMSWWFVLHHARFVPYAVYWCLTPVAVIAGLVAFYDFAIRRFPVAFNVVLGARAGAKPAFVERRKAARPANAPVYSAEERRQRLHAVLVNPYHQQLDLQA
jgi:succinoglycan biosynthesis protein ExoH